MMIPKVSRYVVMQLPLFYDLPGISVTIEDGKQFALGMIESDGVIRVQQPGFASAQAVLNEIEKRTA